MKRGYTLVELLMVLCAISLMMVILRWPNIQSIKEDIVGNLFFDEICQEVNIAQDYAVTKSTLITIVFDVNKQAVVTQEMLYNKKSIDLVGHWTIKSTQKFNFQKDGHINQFDTVEFYNTLTHEKRYLVFHLGSGKFVMEQ